MRLFLLLCTLSILLYPVCAAKDAKDKDDVSSVDEVTPTSGSEVEKLREQVKKLRKTFNRFRRGGRGKKLCEEATGQINDAISVELSGLRSQLHTSDSLKSLRSELEYGLTSLRSEMENKVTSLRAELEMGIASVRSEMQGVVNEMKADVTSELTDVRAELQYSLNAACSGDKELTKAVAEMKASVQGIKSEVENRVSTNRAELEQKVKGVRAELEGGLSTAQAQFKTDVVTVRSDLQDMVSDVRTELQDSVAGTRSELQTGFMAAQSGLQNSLHALQADVTSVSSKANSDLTALKAEISGTVSTVKAEVQLQLTAAASQMKKALQTLEEDQHQQITHLAERLQHLATEHSHLTYNTSTLRQDLVQAQTLAEKGLGTLRDDLDHQMKKLESRVDEAVKNSFLSKNLDSSYKHDNLSDHRVSSLLADLNTRFVDLRIDLDTRIGDLAKRVKDVERERAGGEGRSVQDGGGMADKRLEKSGQDLAEYGGSTFVRWGRTECPEIAQLVYSGVVGGSSYDTDGGAANRLCLTLLPQAGNVTGARTYIYGAEYKFSEHHDLDVVCAVCFTPLLSTLMIPGTQTCPEGWKRQYAGHLTAGMVGHRAASQYLCLDGSPESRPGSQENRNGALFYYVFTECGSLPCPPYNNMYVSCVVCSR